MDSIQLWDQDQGSGSCKTVKQFAVSQAVGRKGGVADTVQEKRSKFGTSWLYKQVERH